MSTIHLVFLIVTVLLPLALCRTSRRLKSDRFDRATTRTIAGVLLTAEIGQFFFKAAIERLPAVAILPMHLCDWALLITAAALWWRIPRLFEVAYFWGLAGTMQGLLTPALEPALALWRQMVFFVVHSGIVVGVLFLVFAQRMRPVPDSIPRVMIWSAAYLLSALAVNALTGQNYGFLAQPPITPSLLDHFPREPWLYVASITTVALGAFAFLYLPWWIVDARARRAVRQPKPEAIPFL